MGTFQIKGQEIEESDPNGKFTYERNLLSIYALIYSSLSLPVYNKKMFKCNDPIADSKKNLSLAQHHCLGC